MALCLLLVTSNLPSPGCCWKNLWCSNCSHGKQTQHAQLELPAAIEASGGSASALYSQCCVPDADTVFDALQPTANAAVTLPTAKKRARAALPPEVAGMAAVQEQKARCPNSSTRLLSASITVGLHSQQVWSEST